MGIKGLMGFCECKGCWNRMDFEMESILHFPDGKKKRKTMRICKKHAIEIGRSGVVQSITVEDTISFNEME